MSNETFYGNFPTFYGTFLPLVIRTFLPHVIGTFYGLLLGHFYPMLLGHFTPFYWDILALYIRTYLPHVIGTFYPFLLRHFGPLYWVRTAEITSQFYSFIFSKGRRDAEFEPSSKEANMYWEEMGFFEPIEKSR